MEPVEVGGSVNGLIVRIMSGKSAQEPSKHSDRLTLQLDVTVDSMYLVQPPYSLAEFTEQPPDKSFSDIIYIPIAFSRQHHPISIRLIRH
jgi:hypothetical protein